MYSHLDTDDLIHELDNGYYMEAYLTLKSAGFNVTLNSLSELDIMYFLQDVKQLVLWKEPN